MKYTLKIKDNRVFKYIFRKGHSYKGNIVSVYTTNTKNNSNINSGELNNFFAVCVSKKNGNSVQRNRLKRYAREVYSHEETKLKRGINVIIIYKKDTLATNVNFYEVQQDILKCFSGLNLYF